MLPTRTLSGTRSTCAYLVLLRVEIARFTRTQSARLCCSNPHLGALRPFGGEVLPPTLSCAVRTFLQCGLSAHGPRKILCHGFCAMACAIPCLLAPAAVWQASRAHYRLTPFACANILSKQTRDNLQVCLITTSPTSDRHDSNFRTQTAPHRIAG